MLWILFEIAVTCFDMAFFFLILSIQVGLKDGEKKKQVFLYCLLSLSFLIVFNHFFQNSITSIFLSVALLIVYSAIFIRGKWAYKAFWLFFPMALLYSVEVLVVAFLMRVHQGASIELFSLQNSYRLQLALGATILQALLFLFISRLKLHLEKLGYACVLGLTVSVVVSISIMLSIELSELINQTYGQTLFFYVCTGVLFLNLLNLWFISITNKKNKQLHQKILEMELKLQEEVLKQKNYEQLLATHERLKNYQEEVDLCMRDLWEMETESFLRQSRAKRLEHQQALVFKVMHLRQKYHTTYCTGSETLDVALASKGDLATKKDIILDARTDLLFEYQHDASVIAGIMTHVLDHAIETVGAVANIEVEKVITLSMATEGDNCKIVVEYPSDSREGIKKLLNHEDIGIQIARGMAEKYQGRFSIDCEEYWCTITIQLPFNAVYSIESRATV